MSPAEIVLAALAMLGLATSAVLALALRRAKRLLAAERASRVAAEGEIARARSTGLARYLARRGPV